MCCKDVLGNDTITCKDCLCMNCIHWSWGKCPDVCFGGVDFCTGYEKIEDGAD